MFLALLLLDCCVSDIGHSLYCDLGITILEGSKPIGFKVGGQRAGKCSVRGLSVL